MPQSVQTLQRTASSEGFEPADLEDQLSEQIVGSAEISNAFLSSNEDQDSGKVDEYQGNDEENQLQDLAEQQRPQLSRSQSRRSSLAAWSAKKFGFFDHELRNERIGWGLNFLRSYVIMIVFMLSAFSIYWGSYYNRASRYHNLHMLVVNGDYQVVDGLEPYIGQSIVEWAVSPQMSAMGTWHPVNASELQDAADSHGLSIEEEVKRLVHHQKYWSAIYVRPNTTYDFYTALKDKDTSFNASNSYISLYYETGRDLLGMQSYVIPFVKQFQTYWTDSLASTVFPQIWSQLSASQLSSVMQDLPQLLALVPQWNLDDMRPTPASVIFAPYQVGSIYLIIITFFQFNIFAGVHLKVAQKLHRGHFILYRLLSSQVSYLVLSLGYSCVSAAFQVDFNLLYKGGFGVYWMVCYLTMSAVGGANENMASIIFAAYPPFLGFWILSWVVLNITPLFSAMALISPFYRYGYAFPIHNCTELMKVVLFNTYKGQVGRNVGILIAWIVINNLVLPFAMKFFASRMKLKAEAEAKAREKR